jgi:Tfp pilus assembly protein PilV
MQLNVLKNNKGLGLVEVIASLGIAVIVLTSLVSLSIYSIRSSTSTRVRLEAINTANQQMDLLRALRDTSEWDTFVSALLTCDTGSQEPSINNTSGCQVTSSLSSINVSGYTVDQNNPQLQSFFLVHDPINTDGLATSDNIIRVTVISRWLESNELRTTTLVTDLSNWRTQ